MRQSERKARSLSIETHSRNFSYSFSQDLSSLTFYSFGTSQKRKVSSELTLTLTDVCEQALTSQEPILDASVLALVSSELERISRILRTSSAQSLSPTPATSSPTSTSNKPSPDSSEP
jgi:hypothetical protein